MDDKSEAKAWNPARIVMLVLLGIVLIAGTLILALNVMTYVQMKNAMNWSPYTDITQEDKDRYASLVMIPEISDQIVASNLRGIRDPQYCIETNWIVGATRFIMFGSAGSLDGEKTNGKFVIPTYAYRDEGMSYHYAPPADYIFIRNHKTLAGIFRELELPYIEGKVWTTDAFGRETVGQMALRKSEGCIAVEMELAGVQAVCDFHGLELYDFLATGDVLSENEYRVEGLKDANHNMDKFYIALEVAKRV